MDAEYESHQPAVSDADDARMGDVSASSVRSAQRQQWSDPAITAATQITANRFEKLTPEQYQQQGYDQTNTQFEQGIPIVIDNGQITQTTTSRPF